jgi:streptomycin 6-kinase
MLNHVTPVPAELMDTIGTPEGEPGRRWIASLPELVEALCADWGLAVDGAPMHGFVALVVPVLRGDERCIAAELDPERTQSAPAPGPCCARHADHIKINIRLNVYGRESIVT